VPREPLGHETEFSDGAKYRLVSRVNALGEETTSDTTGAESKRQRWVPKALGPLSLAVMPEIDLGFERMPDAPEPRAFQGPVRAVLKKRTRRRAGGSADGARRIRTADLLGAIHGGHDRGTREKQPITSIFAELAVTPAVHGCAGISGD
jgi:hypothetical protein